MVETCKRNNNQTKTEELSLPPSSTIRASIAHRRHEMRPFPMTIGRLLALIAVIIFVRASVGSWPDSLQKDLEPVALGLAFLAASFVVP